MSTTYDVRYESTCRFLNIRGWQYHVREWRIGAPIGAHLDAPIGAPPLVMLHGYMDVSASFQFVIDAMQVPRHIISFDWRGFGKSAPVSGAYPDSYWFPDYLGDLDALLDQCCPNQSIDLLGHSMGGNIAMIYAGVRPARIHRLINLEGFGLPDTHSEQAPSRYAKWLDQLKSPKRLRSYATQDDVAVRMQQSNSRLSTDKARWLAAHWAELRADGAWHLLSDTAHKRTNPVLYRDDDIAACRRLITAPTLWVDGADSELLSMFGGDDVSGIVQKRLAVVPQISSITIPDCGHMVHHDQPVALAQHIQTFFSWLVTFVIRNFVNKRKSA